MTPPRCRCRVDQFRSRVGADPALGPPPFYRVDPFRRERIGLEVSVEASVEASVPAVFSGIIPVPSPSRGPLSPAPGMSGDARAPASRRGAGRPSLRGTGSPFRTLRPRPSGWIRPTDILYKGARPPPRTRRTPPMALVAYARVSTEGGCRAVVQGSVRHLRQALGRARSAQNF